MLSKSRIVACTSLKMMHTILFIEKLAGLITAEQISVVKDDCTSYYDEENMLILQCMMVLIAAIVKITSVY